jgi:hypothetical protein
MQDIYTYIPETNHVPRDIIIIIIIIIITPCFKKKVGRKECYGGQRQKKSLIFKRILETNLIFVRITDSTPRAGG